ncbi:GtrA family protein [Paraburkholderia unamae]|uniref:GtrA family protein n=1 Tax=Paraburkholderia unamae TaxID=219649 RepID=UPI0015ECA28A|nr:GtrA family protein [Paraburkholderia unamae]
MAIILEREHAIHQVLRHAVISMACATVEFSLFILLLKNTNLPLFVDYLVSFSAATTVGFIGHSHVTFRLKYMSLRNAGFFLSQALFGLLIGYSIVHALINAGSIPELAKAIQLVLVFTFNFLYGRFISFKKRET